MDYSRLLQVPEEVLCFRLEDIPLSILKTLIFMHGNSPSHSSSATQAFLGSYGIQVERLMVRLRDSSDRTLAENIWSIIKEDVYGDGRQFTLKDIFWVSIKSAAEACTTCYDTEMRDSMTNSVIHRNGKHVPT